MIELKQSKEVRPISLLKIFATIAVVGIAGMIATAFFI